MAGNADAALRTLTDSLPERIELSGTHHRETAVLVNNIGNAYFPRIRARAWSTSTWRMATAAAARK